MSILIAGYPYIRESYFKTLRSYPEKDKLFFLLPKEWKIKDGKVVYHPPKDGNVSTVKAYFFHSHYPIIGGLLKGWMPGYFKFLLREKNKKNIEVVFTLTEPILLTTLYQAVIAKMLGLKHIFFTWENVSYDKFKGLNGLIKRVILNLNLTLSDGVICGNKKAEDIIKKITNKNTAIIPLSGVDGNFFSPFKKERIFKGLDLKNKVVFSFVGSISYRKGIHVALEAFNNILPEIPDATFIIVGSGEYEKEIGRTMNTLGLAQSVHMIPWLSHDELKDLLAVSDVFLYPSLSYGGWEEQFGYSMAEASLMELPVISTFSGSIEDIIINNKTGILVEAGIEKELGLAMIKLAKDINMRKVLGSNGRKYIIENYSYDVVATKFKEFFHSLK